VSGESQMHIGLFGAKRAVRRDGTRRRRPAKVIHCAHMRIPTYGKELR